MDYCFRYALAAGFLALPLSLLAEDHGTPGSGAHRPKGQEQHMRQQLEAKFKEMKKQHPQLTQEQKEKMKAAMQSKMANWKANHPNDTPPTKQQSSKGTGGHFQGGGHPGGPHGGHGGGHK